MILNIKYIIQIHFGPGHFFTQNRWVFENPHLRVSLLYKGSHTLVTVLSLQQQTKFSYIKKLCVKNSPGQNFDLGIGVGFRMLLKICILAGSMRSCWFQLLFLVQGMNNLIVSSKFSKPHMSSRLHLEMTLEAWKSRKMWNFQNFVSKNDLDKILV